MRRMQVRRMTVMGALIALGIGAAATAPIGAAEAAPDPAPVAADDAVVLTPFLDRRVDVLANDAGGDPVSADLQVCRFDPNDAGLMVSIWSRDGWPGGQVIRPGSTYLDVETDRRLPVGDHVVEYAACDRHRTAWATLTVAVRRVGAPRVADDPTRIRFTNPLEQEISVTWWPADGRNHALRLAPGRSREVEVGAQETRWIAYGDIGADESSFLDRGRVPALSGASWPAARRTAQAGPDDGPVDVSPPVTASDHVTLEYSDSADVAVLANDSDDRPGDLAICRVEAPATDFQVTALPVPSWTNEHERPDPVLDVSSSGAAGGDYEFTYYACDREQLTPGTLTVTVREFALPRVHRVDGRPGVVRVHNRGYRTIDVQYYRAGPHRVQKHLWVRPHRSRTVRVSYDTLEYFVNTRIGPLTQGRVRDVQQG